MEVYLFGKTTITYLMYYVFVIENHFHRWRAFKNESEKKYIKRQYTVGLDKIVKAHSLTGKTVSLLSRQIKLDFL